MTLSIKDADQSGESADSMTSTSGSAPGSRPQPKGTMAAFGASDVKSMGTLAEQFSGLFAQAKTSDGKTDSGKSKAEARKPVTPKKK